MSGFPGRQYTVQVAARKRKDDHDNEAEGGKKPKGSQGYSDKASPELFFLVDVVTPWSERGGKVRKKG